MRAGFGRAWDMVVSAEVPEFDHQEAFRQEVMPATWRQEAGGGRWVEGVRGERCDWRWRFLQTRVLVCALERL